MIQTASHIVTRSKSALWHSLLLILTLDRMNRASRAHHLRGHSRSRQSKKATFREAQPSMLLPGTARATQRSGEVVAQMKVDNHGSIVLLHLHVACCFVYHRTITNRSRGRLPTGKHGAISR